MSLITRSIPTTDSAPKLEFIELSAASSEAERLTYVQALEALSKWLTIDCPTAVTLRFRRGDDEYDEYDVFALDSDHRVASSTSDEVRDVFIGQLFNTHGESITELGCPLPKLSEFDENSEWFDVPVNALGDEYERLAGSGR